MAKEQLSVKLDPEQPAFLERAGAALGCCAARQAEQQRAAAA
jgi:hypothetical protein